MAARPTVLQLSGNRNSTPIIPQHGVITLHGYGINVHVDRGHLFLQDGIGEARRESRFPRVGHGIRRLVVIGSDGLVSLAALRWLADQDASFVMLERNGSVVATTGPVNPTDARLRRAQSLAHQSGVALHIARDLISQKLLGQERVVREKLHSFVTADEIANTRNALQNVNSIDAIRHLEARAAYAYWQAWRDVAVSFPQRDLRRVPEYWRRFGTRKSPLTGSPRLAANPPNAMLNYLYALLESECRLALAAMGLDPGIGVLHVDAPARDSFACDLMEAIRPQVDAYVLDWILRQCLRREWFFEERDGNCRLIGSFAIQLSESAETWARAVAPLAESIAHTFWSSSRKASKPFVPATRLTQTRRRRAQGITPDTSAIRPPELPRICRGCGKSVNPGNENCFSCCKEVSRRNLIEAAQLGRIATHTPKAEALRGATQRRQAAALRSWKPSDNPEWLTEEAYRVRIHPLLPSLTVSAISAALQVSEPYAADIRAGRRIPHPRHWQRLAVLTGIES